MVRQENLCPHRIRNRFDNPAPETPGNVVTELDVWEKYLRNFVQRQQRWKKETDLLYFCVLAALFC